MILIFAGFPLFYFEVAIELRSTRYSMDAAERMRTGHREARSWHPRTLMRYHPTIGLQWTDLAGLFNPKMN
jgi:hypothetical protein